MNNLLPEFADVLHCDNHYIYLKPQNTENSTDAIVLSSDSEDFEDADVNNSFSRSMATASKSKAKQLSSKKGRTPWGAGLMSTSLAGKLRNHL